MKTIPIVVRVSETVSHSGFAHQPTGSKTLSTVRQCSTMIAAPAEASFRVAAAARAGRFWFGHGVVDSALKGGLLMTRDEFLKMLFSPYAWIVWLFIGSIR
jgi:hypothetical protein